MGAAVQTYLDHNASAPLLPAARAALLAALELTGNSSSVHRHGRVLRETVEQGREQVARAAGTRPERVILTGSATEALTQAVLGSARAGLVEGILTTAGEHQAVLKAVEFAGVPVVTIGLMPNGEIELEALRNALALAGGAKLLVAVHSVNNETGVVQPMAAVEALLKDTPHLLLVDAVQGYGKLQLEFDTARADMIAVSGHKIGAPAGIGALIVKDGLDIVRLIPGGGQQQNRRGGTESAALASAFGVASEAAPHAFQLTRMRAQAAAIEAAIKARVPGAVIFGAQAERLGSTVNFAIPGLASATALIGFDLAGVSLSAGSACSSGKMARSHVLRAMGVAEDLVDAALRVSVGWSTTDADIENFTRALNDVMARHEAAQAA